MPFPWAPSQGRADQDVRLDSGLEFHGVAPLTPTPLLNDFSPFLFFTEEITKVPVSTSSPGAPRDLAKTLKNARFFGAKKKGNLSTFAITAGTSDQRLPPEGAEKAPETRPALARKTTIYRE